MSSNNCGGEKTSTKVSLMTSSEQKFKSILPEKTFVKISELANYLKKAAIVFYVITAICVLFLFLTLIDGGYPVVPIVLGVICGSIGSFIMLLSEIVFIVLQAEKELYISAKYNYVNAELTEELIKKIDSIKS